MAAEDNVEKKSDGKGGIKSFIAGGCGGVCVVLSGHPFDTIKVSDIFREINLYLKKFREIENVINFLHIFFKVLFF